MKVGFIGVGNMAATCTNLQRMARKMGMGDADSSTIPAVYEKVLGKTVKP